MRNARVDPAAVDAAAVGFRLAADQRHAAASVEPDAALELLLTTEADEAKRLIGGELETLNRDRQAVEDGILRAAVAEVESGRRSGGAAGRTCSGARTGTRA